MLYTTSTWRKNHPEVKRRTDGTFEHGTRNGYANHKCRCNECRAVNTVYSKLMYDNNRDRYINYALKHTYGITLEERNSILVSQGGGCAICNIKENSDGRRFHTDHDHISGQVRGILCGNCNMALGQVMEDEKIAEGLLKYIKEIHKC